VIALSWDPQTGALSRRTDAEEPSLRSYVEIIADTGNRSALDEAIFDTITALVAPYAAHTRP
jgi:hypothetical protein